VVQELQVKDSMVVVILALVIHLVREVVVELVQLGVMLV
jgi:hypothetical protein